MLLDNENQTSTLEPRLKVHEWISKYNETGAMSIVTGYFTIGALAFLAKQTQAQITHYRFILGDIASDSSAKMPALDLLNEQIGINTAMRLSSLAKEAVDFLRLTKVELKTLEPNFCHAKLYVKKALDDERNHYFISGSSNLTEAGIGLKQTSNVELNIAETGNNGQYKELVTWFEQLWNRPQAHTEKTIEDEHGKMHKVPFKQYLIDEISKLFKLYTPAEIYEKMLFELFKQEKPDPTFEKNFGKLENTVIYSKLYDFQRSGVRSLVQMLNAYNGAILADAVGLGKTWSALAVMKFFQMQGFEVLLLCPKKLHQNWKRYQKRQNSLLENDKFEYTIRFHTDLNAERMTKSDATLDYLRNDSPKLIVIDESHNLRNDKSSRYKFLVEHLLSKSAGDVKVLLLSATPINNSFNDVRNQFKLMVRGKIDGFNETLEIKNLTHTFRGVQQVFNEWAQEPSPQIAAFHASIRDSQFFKLMDNLVVARTRKRIKQNFDNTLVFPVHLPPDNRFKTPLRFGDIENFSELLDKLDLGLFAYRPSTFTLTEEELQARKKTQKTKDSVLTDEVQREYFLTRMMVILMLKRLESSWKAFYLTIDKIYRHHENTLKMIYAYEALPTRTLTLSRDVLSEEEVIEGDETGTTEFVIGRGNPVHLADIEAAGRLLDFKRGIKKDKERLLSILLNIQAFEAKMQAPTQSLKTPDEKLHDLLLLLHKKQQQANPKVLIFTAYKDTAIYLYEQLRKHGFEKLAMVSGNENRDSATEAATVKGFESLLGRFAPYTKLFKEQEWREFTPADGLSEMAQYEAWKQWIATHAPTTDALLQQPIDILIATDVLSEGQNLQDADMVINYDIHWNPVRVIQRVGRIDRLGSPNTHIQTVNYWPTNDIDGYINLKSRVEKRMAAMKFVGSEVIDRFTDDFHNLVQDEALEDRQNASMLRQMESSIDSLDAEGSLGYDDFSMEPYRQVLQNILAQKQRELEAQPNGIFSGFVASSTMPPGMIALLGYPARPKGTHAYTYRSHELIYIDKEGKALAANIREVLERLTPFRNAPREVDARIDEGDPEILRGLTETLQRWIDEQTKKTVVAADGTEKTVAGKATLDLLLQVASGSKQALHTLQTEGSPENKYKSENFDLIAWLIVDTPNK